MKSTIGSIGLDTYPCGMKTLFSTDDTDTSDTEIVLSCYGSLDA